MTEKRNLVTRIVGPMIVSRQNEETPTDAEWDDFLKHLGTGRNDSVKVKILVITEGGGPSPAQRRRLQQALSGRVFRVAVVTDSIKVRFIVSSVALLNRDISTFSKSELTDAYRYLDLGADEQRLAMRTIAEMEPLLDLPVKR